jgi:2-oxoglutarate ferredoxin oxidoreductase subunit beta
MTRSIKKAIQKKGFALLEAVSQCPVQYGKATKMGKAVDMLKYFKKQSIRVTKARELDSDALTGKIVVGEFVDVEKPELTTELELLKREVMGDRACPGQN